MENPQIRYHLYSGNGDDVTERLDKGLLDFGVLIEPVDVSKYDFLRIPSKDSWGLLMRRDSPPAQKATITAADFADIPLLVSGQTMVGPMFSRWLGYDMSQLNIVATCFIMPLSWLTRGAALTLDRLINTSGESSLCFTPLHPPPDVGLVIV